MSTHKVEVIRVKLDPHPNADTLSIVSLYNGGYQCVVKTSDWKDGDLAAYIPPDSLVPTDRPEFSFLAREGQSHSRIKAIKLRKYPSMGLLVPAPPGMKEGDDAAAFYGILHYNPPEHKGVPSGKSGIAGWSPSEADPECKPPHYDIENIRIYNEVFTPGEPVVVTEKIHGANCRFVYEPRKALSFSRKKGTWTLRIGKKLISWTRAKGLKFDTLPDLGMRAGSRTLWRKPSAGDLWWKVLLKYPQITKFCRDFPGMVVYGEVYGPGVQSLGYGLAADEIGFAAFDIYKTDPEDRRFVDFAHFRSLCEAYEIPMVPRLGYYDFNS